MGSLVFRRVMVLLSGWAVAVVLAAGWARGQGLVEVGEVMLPCAAEAGEAEEQREEPGAEPASENTILRLQVATLEANVEQLRRAVGSAESEARRYRAGLERAVAELNRPRRDPRLLLAKRAKTRKAQPARKPDSGVLGSRAALRMLGEEVLVSGTIENRRQEFLTGTVWIELLHDEKVIDTASYLAEIGAHERHEYSAKFYAFGYHGGTFSARARFEY